MAKQKPNPFAKLQDAKPKSVSSNPPKAKVEVVTKVKKKMGRPVSFNEPTSRLTADIPTSTLIAMQSYRPTSGFKSQAQLVNAAILAYLEKENQSK